LNEISVRSSVTQTREVLMARKDNLYKLPDNLPAPVDDGACAHLSGLRLPSLPLASTAGRAVDLAALAGITVVYCYPRTGRPDEEPPEGWDEIPGARGCTPQSLAFRDRYEELRALHASLFGLSAQSTPEQREAAQRLELPFELLSDSHLLFARALSLPTFRVASMTLIKRLTLVIFEGRVDKVFYPVFPPDKDAEEVIAWLQQRSER